MAESRRRCRTALYDIGTDCTNQSQSLVCYWKLAGNAMRFLGKTMNKDVMDKLETVENDVKNLKEKHDDLKNRMDKDDADECRTRILRFADELRRGVEHSEEFFNQILDDISDYERYCSEHPEYKNSKAVNAIAKIDKVYQKCMGENSFL